MSGLGDSVGHVACMKPRLDPWRWINQEHGSIRLSPTGWVVGGGRGRRIKNSKSFSALASAAYILKLEQSHSQPHSKFPTKFTNKTQKSGASPKGKAQQWPAKGEEPTPGYTQTECSQYSGRRRNLQRLSGDHSCGISHFSLSQA